MSWSAHGIGTERPGQPPTPAPRGPPQPKVTRRAWKVRANAGAPRVLCLNIQDSQWQTGSPAIVMRETPLVPSLQCLRHLRKSLGFGFSNERRRDACVQLHSRASSCPRKHVRGLKTKSEFDLGDLKSPRLKGALAPIADHATKPSYPTVVQQVLDNVQKYENCIILTRVGSFYEVQ